MLSTVLLTALCLTGNSAKPYAIPYFVYPQGNTSSTTIKFFDPNTGGPVGDTISIPGKVCSAISRDKTKFCYVEYITEAKRWKLHTIDLAISGDGTSLSKKFDRINIVPLAFDFTPTGLAINSNGNVFVISTAGKDVKYCFWSPPTQNSEQRLPNTPAEVVQSAQVPKIGSLDDMATVTSDVFFCENDDTIAFSGVKRNQKRSQIYKMVANPGNTPPGPQDIHKVDWDEYLMAASGTRLYWFRAPMSKKDKISVWAYNSSHQKEKWKELSTGQYIRNEKPDLLHVGGATGIEPGTDKLQFILDSKAGGEIYSLEVDDDLVGKWRRSAINDNPDFDLLRKMNIFDVRCGAEDGVLAVTCRATKRLSSRVVLLNANEGTCKMVTDDNSDWARTLPLGG